MAETNELLTTEPIDLEARIKEIEQATITLSFPAYVLDRIAQKAAFIGLTIEEEIQSIVLQSVQSDVGRAVITGPSTAKHKKITGPSWATGEMS
ncbi:hypothetical protein OAL60_00580 [bacterium]|nr:hypothetical protein [bacterium]